MGKRQDVQKRTRKPASAREQASRLAMIDRNKSQHQAKQVEAARAGRARMQHNLFGVRQNAAADVSAQQPEVADDQPATGIGAAMSAAAQGEDGAPLRDSSARGTHATRTAPGAPAFEHALARPKPDLTTS